MRIFLLSLIMVMRAGCLALLLVGVANSHPMAPTLLNIDMVNDDEVLVRWKETTQKATSISLAGKNILPVFPADCISQNDPVVTAEATAIVYEWRLKCADPLQGREISIANMVEAQNQVFVVQRDLSGRTEVVLLSGAQNTLRMSEGETPVGIAVNYLRVGIEHLLTGWDHLLFVVGLFVLLRRQTSLLLLSVTAFTLGHSLTLALASLGIIPPGNHWVEMAIALSITLVALELLSTQSQLNWYSIKRSPFLLTFAFGLIHGCGFASILAEMLGKEASPLLPLFAFNMGIEIAQIGVLLVLVYALKIGHLFSRHWAGARFNAEYVGRGGFIGNRFSGKWFQHGLAYSMGGISVYWLLVRALG